MAPLPIEMLAGFAAGALFARAARDPLTRTSDPFATRYFLAFAIFVLGVLVPSQALLYLCYPDWCLMYVASPTQLPLVLMLPFLVGAATFTATLGFWAGCRTPSARPIRGFGILLGTAGALLLMLVAFGRDRLLTVAYYESYHYGGVRLPLFKTPLGLWVILSGGTVVGTYLFALGRVRSHVEAFHGTDRASS